MSLYDPGIQILLAFQLALSVWAMWAWARVWQEEEPKRLKWAAGASACWFAMFAAIIAYLYDVGV